LYAILINRSLALPLLRPKIVFDTQILSYVYKSTICPADWNAVLRYISKKCRYAISANTLYELLAGIAKGDANHFHENQSRIRLLCQPAGREFLPTVGDFVRAKVFGLSARKLDFQPRKLCLWAEVALAATRKSSLQSGVTLHKAGRSRQTYGFDLQLLLKQIEEGKQSHSQRLEGLRQGKLLASTPGSWSRSVLRLLGVPLTDANAKTILIALNAAHRYDISLYEMAKNHAYDFSRHDADWIDSQQLYYLADSSVRFVTCDANIGLRTMNSTQRDRVLSFDELKVLAMNSITSASSTNSTKRQRYSESNS
jgi:hypothetical protein